MYICTVHARVRAQVLVHYVVDLFFVLVHSFDWNFTTKFLCWNMNGTDIISPTCGHLWSSTSKITHDLMYSGKNFNYFGKISYLHKWIVCMFARGFQFALIVLYMYMYFAKPTSVITTVEPWFGVTGIEMRKAFLISIPVTPNQGSTVVITLVGFAKYIYMYSTIRANWKPLANMQTIHLCRYEILPK